MAGCREPGLREAAQGPGLTWGGYKGDTSRASVLISFQPLNLKVNHSSFLPLSPYPSNPSSSTPSSFNPPSHPAFLYPSTQSARPLCFPHSREARACVFEPSLTLPTGPVPRELGPPAGWFPPWAAFFRQSGPDLPSHSSACGVWPVEPAPVWLLSP